jgi:hypothetical protein
MTRRFLPLILAIPAALPILAAGCGDSHPSVDSSKTEAKVRGVVKLKGKPAEGGGTISFNPSNVERKVSSFTAKIGDDGSYELTSYTGGNQVKFSGPFLKSEPGIALSTRYCELDSGENVLDFDLLGADDHPRGKMYPKKMIPTASRKR